MAPSSGWKSKLAPWPGELRTRPYTAAGSQLPDGFLRAAQRFGAKFGHDRTAKFALGLLVENRPNLVPVFIAERKAAKAAGGWNRYGVSETTGTRLTRPRPAPAGSTTGPGTVASRLGPIGVRPSPVEDEAVQAAPEAPIAPAAEPTAQRVADPKAAKFLNARELAVAHSGDLQRIERAVSLLNATNQTLKALALAREAKAWRRMNMGLLGDIGGAIGGAIGDIGGAVTGTIGEVIEGVGTGVAGGIGSAVATGISGQPVSQPQVLPGGAVIQATPAFFEGDAFSFGEDFSQAMGLDQANPGVFYKPTRAGASAKNLILQRNPVTGNPGFWKYMGRPVLFSGDLSTCKRVDKLARRAKSARRRP